MNRSEIFSLVCLALMVAHYKFQARKDATRGRGVAESPRPLPPFRRAG